MQAKIFLEGGDKRISYNLGFYDDCFDKDGKRIERKTTDTSLDNLIENSPMKKASTKSVEISPLKLTK